MASRKLSIKRFASSWVISPFPITSHGFRGVGAELSLFGDSGSGSGACCGLE